MRLPRVRTGLRLRALLLSALLVPLPGAASVAIYVGKNLTTDGSVLLAGFGDEPSSHWLAIEPERRHAADATVAVGATENADIPGQRTAIPQVPQTFRYISMDYSYFAGFPEPLTNGGLNEHGLAVRDVALFNRQELVERTPTPQQGPHYADLARLVLERATTAREAVDVATELIEEHGFTTYGGNSHVFADPEEGWVLLELAGGEGLWVARRLGPDEVWINWRGYHETGYVQTLPEDWRSRPDYLASDNFVEFAVQQGWHDPADGALDIIDVYMRQQQYSVHTRQEAGRRLANLAEASPRIDVRLLMDELHASGTDSSGYGQVAHLLAGQPADLRTLWVAPASPLTAAFIPWRIGVDSVPPEYRRHRYLTAGEAERQLIDPRQQGLESTRYVNRAVARLYYLVNEHRDQFLPEVERALRHFENALLAEHETVTRSARLLLEAGEPGLARRFLTRTVHAAAGEGHRLVEDLATGIEARTRYEHGFRMPDE